MKTRSYIYLLLFIVFFLSSCRDISIKTIIHDDGSFTRVVTITGDSADVLKTDLPYPVDSNWVKEFVRDTADSTAFICTYTRTFRNDEELNNEIHGDTGWRSQISRDLEISKRFMFFYSFITYKQIYKAVNPFEEDYHEYLSKEDILWISKFKIPQNKKDSIRDDTAGARLFRYWTDAVVNDMVEDLEEGLSKLDGPGLINFDPSLYRNRMAANIDHWTNVKFTDAIDSLAVWSGNPGVSVLQHIDPPVFRDLNNFVDLIDNLLFSQKYTLEAEMPGLITETNATIMHGNTVSWDVHSLSFYFEDYEMLAESRVMNYWAFVLSGIIVLLLLVAVIVKIFK